MPGGEGRPGFAPQVLCSRNIKLQWLLQNLAAAWFLTSGIGLQSANKFMLGAAIAYNLKKWLNYKVTNIKTAAMALKSAAKAVLFLLFYPAATYAASQQQF